MIILFLKILWTGIPSYNCYLQVLEDEYYTILKKNLPEVKEVKVIILKRYLKLSKK